MAGFVIRFRSTLLLMLIVGVLVFDTLIERVGNFDFKMWLRIVPLPVALAVFGFTLLNLKTFAAFAESRARLWKGSAAATMLVIAFAWPYVMAFNAFFPERDPVIVFGPVVEKWQNTGKSMSNNIRVRDLRSHELIQLRLTSDAYSNVTVGATFCKAYARGALEIPFRWKFNSYPGFEALCAQRLSEAAKGGGR